jgi:hypothetical protein
MKMKDTEEKKKSGKDAPDAPFDGPLAKFQAQRRAEIARKKSERKKK